MKTHARFAGVLGIAVWSLAGCAQHATPMDLDVEPIDEDPGLVRHARAEVPDAEPVPPRCSAAAERLEAEDGWDRSTLRVRNDEGVWELPLRESSFDTLVVGTVAETTVTQVFANPFDEPIEAVYAFPLHEHAAVDDYWIHIGERTLHGEMHRREKARKIYDDAKAKGQRAGLLEQERPNIFTQSVANILPGESIRVEMHVVQPVSLEAGTNTLTLPTVVGPRFIPGTPTGRSGVGVVPDTDLVPDASRISPPTLGAKDDACALLRISVDIENGIGVRGLTSTHHAVTENTANGVTTVELARGYTVANRDFQISWDVTSDVTDAVLLTQPEEGGGGAFTLTLIPPAALEPDEVMPRDLIFVVDNSGSMSGTPIQTAKAVMREAIASMNPNDRFTVLRFSEKASALSRGLLTNTEANRKRGLDYVEAMQGMGGTHMEAGIEAALKLAQSKGRVPMVLLLTDGYIGHEGSIFGLVAKKVGNARIFGLGVGDAPNRHLLDGVSKMGRGAVGYVANGEPVEETVARFYRRISSPALSDIEIDWGGLPVSDVVPGRMPDLFVGQSLAVYGSYARDAAGTVVVEGRQAGEKVRLEFEVDLSKGTAGTGLRAMWARTRIEALLRGRDVYRMKPAARKRRKEVVTKIALANRVLTEYTAFVAVDSEVATKDGARTVAVPVEPVQGMSMPPAATPRRRRGASYGSAGLGVVGKGVAGGASGATMGYGRGSGTGFGGRGKRVPKVRMAKPTVAGALDKDVIRRVVRSHSAALRACYESTLNRDPNAKFRVVVAFVIDAEGNATAVLEWADDAKTPEGFDACLTKVLAKVRFPKPPGGGVVKVRYPLLFNPG
jgi:Ca-activated chloride channel family protein